VARKITEKNENLDIFLIFEAKKNKNCSRWDAARHEGGRTTATDSMNLRSNPTAWN
jgi:hypothetical protein